MQTKTYFYLALLFVSAFCTCVRAQSISIALDASSANQLTIAEAPAGTYTISTTGLDPYVGSVPLTQAYNHDAVYVLSFEYEAVAGLDNLQIFYGSPFSAQRQIDFGSLPAASSFRTFKAFMKIEAPEWDDDYAEFRFDFGVTAGQDITVRNIQLRTPTAREVIPFSLEPTMRNQAPITANANGGFEITTNGGDPWVRSTLITEMYHPDSVYVLSFDYTSTSGINNNFQIFYGQPDNPARRVLYPALPPATDTSTFTAVLGADATNWDQFYDRFRFDWGTMAGLDIQVSNFMLREPTNAESKLIVPPAETVMLELNTGFTSGNMTASEPSPMIYELVTVGPDPWIRSKPLSTPYNTETSYIMEFEYKATGAYNELQVFFGPPINATQSFTTGEIPAAADWTTYTINPRLLVDNFQVGNWTDFRFDFGRNEDPAVAKTFDIRNIKIRKPTAQELLDEQNSDKFVSRALNTELQTYLGATFPGLIDSVIVTETEVKIVGNIPLATTVHLAEVLPEDYGFNQFDFVFTTPLNQDANGDFVVTVDRFTPRNGGDADRLYSRWIIVEQLTPGDYTKLSHLAWPTDLCFYPTYNLPEVKASNAKGLDGLTTTTLPNFSDLTDLGVSSMKINLLLNGVFSQNGTGGASHTFNGKTYGINQTFVSELDARVKACYDAGIKVAFVLLLPINIGNQALRDIFVHPDAVGWSASPYTMANVTSAAGVEHYTALVDFLSERYSRTDGLYGRADQWIIHNEVDAHQSWTYAGQKPVELYTQLYDRSMRLVHYTIRKHNPTAKVFGSFTKHWNSKAGSDANFRSLDILNSLTGLNGVEGDYEWGIGWHSYPTNLFNPLVWNDAPAQTLFNFNTPQITPKNIEVIDAYVRQTSLLYRGKKVRTILLSENGFNSNTATNANANETTQAAALAYFWKKVNNRLPTIENIQLHRWVDHPNEAGIHFGLWSVLDGTVDGFDQKKESWDVWNAAGTAQEDNIFDPYLTTVGVSSWSEIMNTVATETTPWPVTMALNCYDPAREVMVNFNGEKKFPQPDGSLHFYNVASNVNQPYEVYQDGELVASDVLTVSAPLNLNVNLCALPVAWLAFSATALEKSVLLKWETTTDQDNAGFTVQRSSDGRNWTDIAKVSANNSARRQQYQTADDNPLDGRSFYRIVQTDFDDEISVSPIRTIDFAGTSALLTITPNPSTGLIRLQLPEGFELKQLQLTDATGRTTKMSLPDHSGILCLDDNPKGVYLVRAFATDGRVLGGKLILR
ncbi:T9SS type A sorting domain-containing protein [Neolewinella aurantiaca]|uniref:T9SS type A sorting domain-containing protein n=1 Tax=Neolewinella aurantiaca TaxID=2602767 RepID=A0A5C7F3C7_9BACT|nr:DUF5722 domain-containing protein [Neolewinella aurantiaca]TXF81996.1 T9SS type A sorting domain-containing protein [Neolewinella aurantiaca]